MKIISTVEDANKLLNSYIGSLAQIYIFSISLKRMVIKLKSPKFQEVIFVVGVSCEYISGCFNWENASVTITMEKNDTSTMNKIVTKIIDKNAGFELVTSGGFAIAQGFENEFGKSLENFLLP